MRRRVTGAVAVALASACCAGAAASIALAQGGPVQAQGNNTFSPNAVAITAGQTVRFLNQGNGTHNVFFAGNRLTPNGTTFDYTTPALAAGSYTYYCQLHSNGTTGMVVNVTVTAAPTTPPPPTTPGTPTTPTTPTTPGTPDAVAPKATKVAATGTLKRAVVKLRLSEAATVTARLTRLGQTTTLKRVVRSLQAGDRQVTLTRTLSAGKRYRVSLRIVDTAGNTSTKTVSFTAKRPS